MFRAEGLGYDKDCGFIDIQLELKKSDWPQLGLGTIYLQAVDNYKERSLQPFIALFSWGLFWERSWIVDIS